MQMETPTGNEIKTELIDGVTIAAGVGGQKNKELGNAPSILLESLGNSTFS
jgi:hypothetical protein